VHRSCIRSTDALLSTLPVLLLVTNGVCLWHLISAVEILI